LLNALNGRHRYCDCRCLHRASSVYTERADAIHHSAAQLRRSCGLAQNLENLMALSHYAGKVPRDFSRGKNPAGFVPREKYAENQFSTFLYVFSEAFHTKKSSHTGFFPREKSLERINLVHFYTISLEPFTLRGKNATGWHLKARTSLVFDLDRNVPRE